MWWLILATAFAHGVSDADQRFIEASQGLQVVPFLYLGAKHMVTGYDHLLFLVGVVFYLFRMKDVATTVTLFSLGHSLTLTLGVLIGVELNAALVDAVIGLSVTYKGLDNLGMWKHWTGFQPDARVAVFLFGLVHGFGLATKLQDFELDRANLLGNLLSFNAGVEIGQFLALGVVLVLMGYWRHTRAFVRQARGANLLLVGLGGLLAAYQISLFLTGEAA